MCTMLRIWRNLRINLRAWPRMGASLLLAEKLTKLPLAELGFCFVMLALSTPRAATGFQPGTSDLWSDGFKLIATGPRPIYDDSRSPKCH